MDASEGRKRVLCCGLGGGLDMVNASLPFFALAKDPAGPTGILGSARPCPPEDLRNVVPFADNGCMMSSTSTIEHRGRYIEPKVSKIIGEEMVFFSARTGDEWNPAQFSIAIERAVEHLSLDAIIFVDGGGDSLILQPGDEAGTSEGSDPFKGGDAVSMDAIYRSNAKGCSIYHAVVSMGLDVGQEAFQKNVKLLEERGAYCGRVNLRTGEKDKYKLDHVVAFKEGFLEDYFKFAEEVLIIEKQDCKPKTGKTFSHTATVTYHALKGNFGKRRTYVPWEPTAADGTKGIEVTPDHAWMYFFDAKAVEQLKRDLNGK